MKRDYAKEKEGKLTYNYCKDCSKRVMNSELEMVDGRAYHQKCYRKLHKFIVEARAKAFEKRDQIYKEMLRKHKGLR